MSPLLLFFLFAVVHTSLACLDPAPFGSSATCVGDTWIYDQDIVLDASLIYTMGRDPVNVTGSLTFANGHTNCTDYSSFGQLFWFIDSTDDFSTTKYRLTVNTTTTVLPMTPVVRVTEPFPSLRMFLVRTVNKPAFQICDAKLSKLFVEAKCSEYYATYGGSGQDLSVSAATYDLCQDGASDPRTQEQRQNDVALLTTTSGNAMSGCEVLMPLIYGIAIAAASILV